jgi:hypothetical protein
VFDGRWDGLQSVYAVLGVLRVLRTGCALCCLLCTLLSGVFWACGRSCMLVVGRLVVYEDRCRMLTCVLLLKSLGAC